MFVFCFFHSFFLSFVFHQSNGVVIFYTYKSSIIALQTGRIGWRFCTTICSVILERVNKVSESTHDSIRFDSIRFDVWFCTYSTFLVSNCSATTYATLLCTFVPNRRIKSNCLADCTKDYGRLLIQVQYTGVIPKFEELTICWLVSVPPVCECVCGDFPQDERKKEASFGLLCTIFFKVCRTAEFVLWLLWSRILIYKIRERRVYRHNSNLVTIVSNYYHSTLKKCNLISILYSPLFIY